MTVLLAGWAVSILSLIGLIFFGALAAILLKQLKNRSRELEELKSQVLEWNRRLEEKVRERIKDQEELHRRLQESYLEAVTALVEAMTAKDIYLSGHSHNVAIYAQAIAEQMGLPAERVRRLVRGCELHDLGKIAIPDAILLKRGPLTNEEFEIIKQHPRWGARILEPLTFMKDITEMVHQEHERWDGTGYPQGIKGEQIRLEARIIAVADALDAMTSERPYRKPAPLEEACAELKRCAGTQFDPQVVESALKAVQEGKLTIAEQHPHPSPTG